MPQLLKPWVHNLSLKMQTVLMTGIRGSDSRYMENCKTYTRWIRAQCVENADMSTKFMKDITLPRLEDLEKELDYCTVHFFGHLIHCMTIIAYKHDDSQVRRTAWYHLYGLTGILHLQPETEEEINNRLKDNI